MSKSISIREYDLLSKDERHKFVENGGVVVGDPLPKSIPRSEFNRLNQTDRRKFFSAGGIVEDPAPKPVGPKIADPKLVTRSEFAGMSPVEQAAVMRDGRKVVNGHRVPPDASDSTSASDGYAWKLPPP
jgi:hypothetical protein